MTEQLRNEIVRLRGDGRSIRGISRQLRVSRKVIRRVLAEVHRQRREGIVVLPPAPRRRTSVLDPFEQDIHGLLEQYPDLTAVRLMEKLRARGFSGGYTIVKDYLRRVRPRPKSEPGRTRPGSGRLRRALALVHLLLPGLAAQQVQEFDRGPCA